MPLEHYRRADPDPTVTSGMPVAWVPIGRMGVARQLSEAAEAVVDSTSALDVQTAYVEGVVAINIDIDVADFVEIRDFYLSKPAAGTVTLHQELEGGTELARIRPGETRADYYGFYLWPTPASAITYFVDARIRTTSLVNGGDAPPWDEDFHDLLVDYAVMRHFEKDTDDTRFIQAKSRYERRLGQLKYFTQSLPGELPVMGGGTPIGHSRLGPWFPADYWTY
jgi:hypothetical protein